MSKQEEKVTAVLKAALEWCITDRDNEDGWPTQEMLENRVAVLHQVINQDEEAGNE